jgi:hypothetical protein
LQNIEDNENQSFSYASKEDLTIDELRELALDAQYNEVDGNSWADIPVDERCVALFYILMS